MAGGPYVIHIKFQSAKDLPPGDTSSFPPKMWTDPFVRGYIDGYKQRSVYSTVVEKNLNPKWPELGNTKTLAGVSYYTDILVFDV
jgi:Ca2+-dependent lipid-binding protein